MNDDLAAHKAQTRIQFNSVSADYDKGPGCFAHFGRRLVAAADIQPGQRILDVASGRGAVLFPAAERAGDTGDAVGIDLAEDMVRAANEEAARSRLKARVQVMDAEQLEFPDAAFDRVLSGFGIMFFPRQEHALSEFRRVLKSGGRLAVSTWRITQASELERVLADMGMAPPRHSRWITEADVLDRLLTRVGFTDVRVTEDSHAFCYTGADEYWQQARGTGMRRTLDALDASQAERARAGLAERMRSHQRPDGIYLSSTALIAVANR